MAHRHRGILCQKQKRHGFADDVAASDHRGVFSGKIDAGPGDQFHDAPGRAGNKQRRSGDETTDIGRMKSVHVFVRVNDGNDFIRGNGFGQGKLNQNAVNLPVVVQIANQGQKLSLSDIGGKPVFARQETRFRAGLGLSSHVNFRGGIVTREDDGKTGHNAGFLREDQRLFPDLLKDFPRDFSPIDNDRHNPPFFPVAARRLPRRTPRHGSFEIFGPLTGCDLPARRNIE